MRQEVGADAPVEDVRHADEPRRRRGGDDPVPKHEAGDRRVTAAARVRDPVRHAAHRGGEAGPTAGARGRRVRRRVRHRGRLRLRRREQADRHGHDEQRDAERDDERERERQRQRLEERAHHPGDEHERQQDDDRRQARADERRKDLVDAGRGRVPGRVFFLMALDVLDHDDRVVGDEAERGGDARERHEVERLPERRQRERDDGDGERDGDHRHDHQPPLAQEREQHERGEPHADQDRVAHAGERIGDELALVIEVGPTHAGGQQPRLRAEQVGDAGGDGHRVGRGLPHDVDEHGRLAVGRGADVRHLVGDAHRAELA